MIDDIERASGARRGTPFLNSAQAAAYLGLSQRLFEEMRRVGKGPPFRRHSRLIRYHIDDLATWSKAQSDPGNRS